MELEADDDQLDCPFLYAIGREGVAMRELEDEREDLTPLFETIVETIPPPPSDADGAVPDARLDASTTRPTSGGSRSGGSSAARAGRRPGRAAAVTTSGDADAAGAGEDHASSSRSSGLERVEIEDARRRATSSRWRGSRSVEIGSTLTDPEHPRALLGIKVEEPTVSVDFMVNNSPFAGREGKYVTSRQVRERLFRELESNVALRVEETDQPDTLTVRGRGELHLGILMETMRREGYEFAVSRPRVILKTGADGQLQEPYEEVTIDVPETLMGTGDREARDSAGRRCWR